VSAGSFINGEFISSHWMVVVVIGLAFFAVQLALSIRFYFRMRQQERFLRLLCRDFEQGIADLQLQARSGNSDWVNWVIVNYSIDSPSATSNFTRDDALQELDARIVSSSDYLLLQRMGIMAPLLGVVLTVIGFYWLEIGTGEQSLQTILFAVAPLVSGVGTGAVLALINQALLHIAGHRAESLRMTARKWFDMAIWSRVNLDTRAATGHAVSALNQLSASLGDASTRYAQGASQINASTVSMSGAASQFHDVVRSFSAEIKGIPEALRDVRRATTASTEALEELIHVGFRAVANLDVSVAAFRSTIDREFAAAAKLQHRSGRLLTKSAQQIDAASERIQSGSHKLNDTAHANQIAFARMDASMQQHVLGGNQQFHDTVGALTRRIADFGQEVSALSSIVEGVAKEFNKMTGVLAPSVTSLRETIDNRFAVAVSQQSTQVESVNQSMQRLQGAADILTDAGKQMQQSIKIDAEASQRTIDEISTSLASFGKQLSEFVTVGLDPATRRLAALHDTLADFEAAVDAIYEFDDAGDNAAQATNSGDQLSVDADPDSRSGFMSWLSHRPR